MKQLVATIDCGRIAGSSHEPRLVIAGGEKYVIKRTQPKDGKQSKEHGNEALAKVIGPPSTLIGTTLHCRIR